VIRSIADSVPMMADSGSRRRIYGVMAVISHMLFPFNEAMGVALHESISQSCLV